MPFENIEPYNSLPDDVTVIIEITANSPAVKYEVEKNSGLLRVDRFMPTAMHYPCDYGFIPNTLAEDGDPADVLIVSPLPIQPGCIMQVRLIGMLQMVDESGNDNKLIALPVKKICSQLAHKDSLEDLSPVLLDSIQHFFQHYKGLEKEKWVKLGGFVGVEEATKEVLTGVERFVKQTEEV